ncbi:hypothetical protein BC833DRAFT_584708 [Globomyces pollinis-pini]|nr:hypothetical protein BC833DRAFT_584708 [Globomyces pollinis-pini]
MYYTCLFIVLPLLSSSLVIPGKETGLKERRSYSGRRLYTRARKGKKDAAAVTPVGVGNSQPCQDQLNAASQILDTMEQLLAVTQQGNPAATDDATLSTNLDNLATYEGAVDAIGPILNSAAACSGFTATNNRFAQVRVGWADTKVQTRTAQLQTGAPDGTAATPDTKGKKGKKAKKAKKGKKAKKQKN